MAASDYIIVAGCWNAYLARNRMGGSRSKSGLKLMSQDRRVITESEMIGLFEFYLRKYCEEHKTDRVTITDANGKGIFHAILLDKEVRDEE